MKYVKTVMKEKAWENGEVKLLVNVVHDTQDHQAWMAMRRIMVEQTKSARILPGKAPPGKMEELLQSMLEDFQGEAPAAAGASSK